MGQKLQSFLRVVGSALSPQAAQANLQLFQQEQAEKSQIAGEQRADVRQEKAQSFQAKIATVSALASVAKANPNNMEIQQRIGGRLKELTEGDPRLKEAVIGYLIEGSDAPADELGGGPAKPHSTIFAGTAGKAGKGPTFELGKIEREIDRLSTLEQTSRVKQQLARANKRAEKLVTVTGRTAEDLSASQKGKVKLAGIEGESSITQNVHEIDNLIKTFASPDFIGGTAGDVIQGLNSVRAQVAQLTGGEDLLNEDGSINEAAMNISKGTSDRLQRSASQGDLAESQTLQLAFVLAKSLNPDGKISDADVRQAENILSKTADPKARAKVLRDVQRRLLSNYNIEQKVIAKSLGKKYTPLRMKDLRRTAGTTVDGIVVPEAKTQVRDKFDSLFKVP